MSKRIVKTAAAQGELYFTRVAELPAGLTEQQRDGATIVGHSETGHNHVIRDGVTLHEFTPRDPCMCYLQVDSTLRECAELEHLRSFDAHPSLMLIPGAIYRVKRAREFTPQGWQMAQD